MKFIPGTYLITGEHYLRYSSSLIKPRMKMFKTAESLAKYLITHFELYANLDELKEEGAEYIFKDIKNTNGDGCSYLQIHRVVDGKLKKFI